MYPGASPYARALWRLLRGHVAAIEAPDRRSKAAESLRWLAGVAMADVHASGSQASDGPRLCTSQARDLMHRVQCLCDGRDDAVPRELADELRRLLVEVECAQRRWETERCTDLPQITSYDGSMTLGVSVLREDALWNVLESKECDIPGMVTQEETRYYSYLTQFYAGVGEAVELGPWLGRSTFYIAQGLMSNPRFAGRRLAVFDDFVWRSSWMDQYYKKPDAPPNHESFQDLFIRFAAGHADSLDVRRAKITDYDGNERLEQIGWDGRPVEMLFVDCGRTVSANVAWFEVFQPAMISGRTLLVLQDWQTHKEVPPKWYNQMDHFTGMFARNLRLIHELRDGGAATFLYVAD